MKRLFDKVELNHLTARNRLVRSATWEGITDTNGSVSENAYAIYRLCGKQRL